MGNYNPIGVISSSWLVAPPFYAGLATEKRSGLTCELKKSAEAPRDQGKPLEMNRRLEAKLYMQEILMDTWCIPGYSRTVLIWHVFLVGSLGNTGKSLAPILEFLVFVERILRGWRNQQNLAIHDSLVLFYTMSMSFHWISLDHMHLWFIWWGRGHGGCYLVWDDGHWGSWVGCVGFVWRWFLEAGSEIDHDLLTSFGMPIQPRQDCIFRSCSFIQKEVLNAPDLFSRCSAKNSGHGWAWTCSSGWRWGCQYISKYCDVQFDLTINIINIDDLDDRIVNKLMNQNDTLAIYQEVI